jgi:hypothetical protein
MSEKDEAYFTRRTQEELDLAAATTDPDVKATHLNRAAEYATARERLLRASAPAPTTR